MLVVYTHRIPKPADCMDLSGLPLDELCEAALNICEHHKTGVIWLGYLDGWMLTPREEVVMRDLIRRFSCSLVSHFPVSLPHAWKNEIKTIYTSQSNGDS